MEVRWACWRQLLLSLLSHCLSCFQDWLRSEAEYRISQIFGPTLLSILINCKKTLQKGLTLSFKNIFATNSLNLLKPRTEVVSFQIFWIPDQENKTKPNQTKTKKQSKTKQTKKTTRNKFSFIYIFHASIFGLFLSTTLWTLKTKKVFKFDL